MPDVEDFASPEVGIAVAATTALMNPAARKVLRRGLVLGLVGGLFVWESIRSRAATLVNHHPGQGALADISAEAHEAAAAKGRRSKEH